MQTLQVKYRPRRATKARWLLDAPDFVLDVFDHGPKYPNDRYTVMLGGHLLQDCLLRDRKVMFIAINEAQHVAMSYFGEVEASWRPAHQRIKWSDLPPLAQAAVRARCAPDVEETLH